MMDHVKLSYTHFARSHNEIETFLKMHVHLYLPHDIDARFKVPVSIYFSEQLHLF